MKTAIKIIETMIKEIEDIQEEYDVGSNYSETQDQIDTLWSALCRIKEAMKQ